jgi:translation initiation factor 2A
MHKQGQEAEGGQKQQQQQQQHEEKEEEEEEEESQGAMTAEEAAKKAKAVEKKLRQIAGLKEKQAAGVALDADQLQKIAAEADLRDQLQKLKL